MNEFISDGCSYCPDEIFGHSLREACFAHDYFYCTRVHDAGDMTSGGRRNADKAFRHFLSLATPWWLYWYCWLMWAVVRITAGDMWDSCGVDAGEVCRHNQTKPLWMH